MGWNICDLKSNEFNPFITIINSMKVFSCFIMCRVTQGQDINMQRKKPFLGIFLDLWTPVWVHGVSMATTAGWKPAPRTEPLGYLLGSARLRWMTERKRTSHESVSKAVMRSGTGKWECWCPAADLFPWALLCWSDHILQPSLPLRTHRCFGSFGHQCDHLHSF